MPLSKLTPPEVCEETETAQRFLASAYDSVDDVLQTRQLVRATSRQEGGKSHVGAPSGSEQDLLRAALVFSGAGLDATLKQLVRDALPALLPISGTAQKHFEAFVQRAISGSSDEVRPAALAKLLVSPSPRDTLLNNYVYDLTGSSLQSTEQAHRTIAALGIEDRKLTASINQLRDMFVARNEIAHELDLVRVRSKGDRTRRTRQVGLTETMCNQALEVAQQVVNAVTRLLGKSTEAPGSTAKKSATAKKTAAKKTAAKKPRRLPRQRRPPTQSRDGRGRGVVPYGRRRAARYFRHAWTIRFTRHSRAS